MQSKFFLPQHIYQESFYRDNSRFQSKAQANIPFQSIPWGQYVISQRNPPCREHNIRASARPRTQKLTFSALSHFASLNTLQALITSKANAFDFIIKGLSDILLFSLLDFIPLSHKTYYFLTFIIKNAFRHNEKLTLLLQYSLLLITLFINNNNVFFYGCRSLVVILT